LIDLAQGLGLRPDRVDGILAASRGTYLVGALRQIKPSLLRGGCDPSWQSTGGLRFSKHAMLPIRG
jgi:hypothetical protein